MGLGRVLGHAMMGYGKGKALVAQSEMEAQAAEVENKRRIALENLRAQNDSTARRETAETRIRRYTSLLRRARRRLSPKWPD